MSYIDLGDENNEQDNLVEITKEEEQTQPVEKGELEFNKNNREYSEKLMEESSTNKDGYWDSNNLFVRILLLALGVIIVIGSAYYIFTYLTQK